VAGPAAGNLAGPAVAAAILSLGPWPWLFAVNIPLALGLLLLGWRSLPANRSPAPAGARVPWLDGLLNAAMFLLLFVGVQRLVPHGAIPASPTLGWALIAAGVVVGVGYVRRQRRQAVPLLPVASDVVDVAIPYNTQLHFCPSFASVVSSSA
jgi:DHA2 family multidrug resistance protein-like MFS transporter